MCEVTHDFKPGDLVMVQIKEANRYFGWPAEYRGPLPVIKISQFGKPVVKAPGFGGYFGLTVDPFYGRQSQFTHHSSWRSKII